MERSESTKQEERARAVQTQDVGVAAARAELRELRSSIRAERKEMHAFRVDARGVLADQTLRIQELRIENATLAYLLAHNPAAEQRDVTTLREANEQLSGALHKARLRETTLQLELYHAAERLDEVEERCDELDRENQLLQAAMEDTSEKLRSELRHYKDKCHSL